VKYREKNITEERSEVAKLARCCRHERTTSLY